MRPELGLLSIRDLRGPLFDADRLHLLRVPVRETPLIILTGMPGEDMDRWIPDPAIP
jgi:hypothetical protein